MMFLNLSQLRPLLLVSFSFALAFDFGPIMPKYVWFHRISITSTEGGYVRALKTDIELPWLETCQRTVRIMSVNGHGRRPAEV